MAQKYKQQADGRWRAKVWDGTYLEGGRKHYVQLTSYKSSKDLEKMVTEYEAKRMNGLLTVTQAISVQEYARQWMKTKKGLSESATKDMYNNIVEVHLKSLAGVPFEYFTSDNIQQIINANKKQPRTCQQIIVTLKQVCRSAEDIRLIPAGGTVKLFKDLQVPKYKAKEKEPLSDEQCAVVQKVLDERVLPPRSALFLALVYFCGLRREEALAVKKRDIHSLAISVDKALHLGPTVSEVKETKTERGKRTVPLPPEAVKVIQLAASQLKPNEEKFLFTTKDGKLITKSSYTKMWMGIEKALGFPCTAHIFRHTYCTRLCYEAYKNRTISVKQIARLLGDTEQMVTKVYSHVVEKHEQTAEALTSVFSNTIQKVEPVQVQQIENLPKAVGTHTAPTKGI